MLMACTLITGTAIGRTPLAVVADEGNDLWQLLQNERIEAKRYDALDHAVDAVPAGAGLIVTARNYPDAGVKIDSMTLEKLRGKGVRMFVEYVAEFPGVKIDSVFTANLERGVVTVPEALPGLKSMDILGLNGSRIYVAEDENPIITFAKVAGFDSAPYGLKDTQPMPLLVRHGDAMVAYTALSNFKTARYAPVAKWQTLWTNILSWLTDDKSLTLTSWPSDPAPAYGRTDSLAAGARREAVRRGADWLAKARLIVHPEKLDTIKMYMGDGITPFGPAAPQSWPVGDGSNGILEGHCSKIAADGSEHYRYWLRADVQGETAFLLASAGELLSDTAMAQTSRRVLDYLFFSDDYTSGSKRDPKSDAYGLIAWAITAPGVYYNDDNARCVLGAIGASALLGETRWNEQIVNNILANLSLSSRQGFLPDRLEEPDLMKNGKAYYAERDFVLPHPHFESWMWACYLWLYDKTHYQPLLDKARTAIGETMKAYPDKWQWTNGIQQERARMILPLAWLVRVDDTPEHREWLDTVVQRLLANQDSCGAIREELGGEGLGMFGTMKSNADYGVTEAPLIFENGDPVADMLYTTNFGFFALNEAAHATGSPQYREAVDKISDFLIRIQSRSEKHPDLDGAWMRAFDYRDWDYWASNADSGWGVWSTLTGWIQSWIVATQSLVEKNQSYWDITGSLSPEIPADSPLVRE